MASLGVVPGCFKIRSNKLRHAAGNKNEDTLSYIQVHCTDLRSSWKANNDMGYHHSEIILSTRHIYY